MSEDPQQQNTEQEEQELARRQRAAGEEPDVLLDVSQLEVERITLEVDDLRAHSRQYCSHPAYRVAETSRSQTVA